MVMIAGAGLAVSVIAQAVWTVHVQSVSSSFLYGKGISFLLAVGLFASVYGISRRELRRNVRVVLLAITLGVALKAGLVGAIMALAYGSIGYLLLGIAVAQIDPLSVAATLRRSGMSERARAILAAWASFDDPVTVLLVYAGSFTLAGARQGLGGSAGSYLSQIVGNAALIGVAAIAWYVLAVLLDGRAGSGFRLILQCLVLAGLLAAATGYGLLIGITVCGLFYRPPIASILDRAVDLAFYAAAFLLGLLLVTGVDIEAGILLGVSVFVVQALTALVVTPGLPRPDRVHLALGQQNGLTAIVLGLALQPYLPQAVGIIATAILTVNVINLCSNRPSVVAVFAGRHVKKRVKNVCSARPISALASRPMEERRQPRDNPALSPDKIFSDGPIVKSSYTLEPQATLTLGVSWRDRGPRCSHC